MCAEYKKATGNVGDHILTVTDSSDDAKHNEPQEHTGSVAQQQDEEQTDHHGYHQTTAKAQARCGKRPVFENEL